MTVLRNQWASSKTDLELLSQQLVPSQELAENIAARVAEAESREECIWADLKELREHVLLLEASHQDVLEGSQGE